MFHHDNLSLSEYHVQIRRSIRINTGMKISDLLQIIIEAPLADFGVVDGFKIKSLYPEYNVRGDGSFRPTDMKAVKNIKWVEKVHDFFKKCPYTFNIYILDGPEKYRDLTHKRGITDATTLKQVFGIEPPNAENSINILLTNNEGANRIALTPWILCHRIVHSFFENDKDDRFALVYTTKDYIAYFTSFLRTISPNMEQDKLFDTFSKLSNFKSAKNKKLTQVGEYLIELIVEYILTGEIKFNLENKTIKINGNYYDYDFLNNSEYAELVNYGEKYFIEKLLKKDGFTKIPKKPNFDSYVAYKNDEPIASFNSNYIEKYKNAGVEIKKIEPTKREINRYNKYQELLKKYQDLYSVFHQSQHYNEVSMWKDLTRYQNGFNKRANAILNAAVGHYFIL